MPTLDTHDVLDFSKFNDPENIAFRAACNGAAPPSRQPIKMRVLRRIHCSEDAKAIFTRLQNINGIVGDDKFATLLAADLCWKTLIIEQVAEENSWSDLIVGNNKISELGKSFFEKLWDGTNHPAAKTASAIILSIAGITATNKINPKILAIPVTPILSTDAGGNPALPLSFKTDGAGEPLKVQLQLPTSAATLPVDLKFKTDGTPIDFKFAKDNEPSETIQDLTAQVSAANQSIMAVSTNLHSLSNRPLTIDTNELSKSMSGISSNLTKVSTLLDNLNGEVESLNTTEEQQYKNLDKSIHENINASQFKVISLVLHQGVPQSAVLPYLDGAGNILTRTVKFAASTIDKDADGPFVKLICVPENGTPLPPLTLYEGKSYELLRDPNYRISLNTTSRKWFVSKMVEVSLTPQAE